jgi:hypothetical protein
VEEITMNDLLANMCAAKRGALTTKNDFEKLESLAFQRAQQGLALPREVYALPFRNWLDWSRFPAWAWPADPDLFNECGHEG